MDRGSEVKEKMALLVQRDDVQSIVKILLAGIPVVGGALSSVMGDVQSKWKEDRLLKLIKQISEKAGQVAGRLDEEYVKKEEFYFFFEQAMREYILSSDEAHQDFYCGLIVSSMFKGAEENYQEREYYLKKLREYSSIHLDLLRLYYNPEKALELKGLSKYNFPESSYKSIVTTYLFNVDFNIIRAAHQDLYNAKLINTNTDLFGAALTKHSIDSLADRVTESGKKMVEMCLPMG